MESQPRVRNALDSLFVRFKRDRLSVADTAVQIRDIYASVAEG